jgi:cell shape-determining protein MreC
VRQKDLLDLSLSTVESLSRQAIDLEHENQTLKSELSSTHEHKQSRAAAFHDGNVICCSFRASHPTLAK